jgi:hypothetical protein
LGSSVVPADSPPCRPRRRGEAARRSSAATERFPPLADPQVRPPTQTPGYSRALMFAKCMRPHASHASPHPSPRQTAGFRRSRLRDQPSSTSRQHIPAGSSLAGRAEPLTSDRLPDAYGDDRGRSGVDSCAVALSNVGGALARRAAQRRWRSHTNSAVSPGGGYPGGARGGGYERPTATPTAATVPTFAVSAICLTRWQQNSSASGSSAVSSSM